MSKNLPAKEFVGIRVKRDTKKLLEKLLDDANKKLLGRKIKIDEIIKVAISCVSNESIKELQNKSLTNEDRKEQLRQIYIKKMGQISRDEFTGFMLAPEFQEFLNSHKSILKTA